MKDLLNNFILCSYFFLSLRPFPLSLQPLSAYKGKAYSLHVLNNQVCLFFY